MQSQGGKKNCKYNRKHRELTDDDKFWRIFNRHTLTAKGKNGHSTMQVTHIVKYLEEDEILSNLEFQKWYEFHKIDLSHLCGFSGCLNLRHLIFKPYPINVEHIKCHAAEHFQGHVDKRSGTVLPDCIVLPKYNNVHY